MIDQEKVKAGVKLILEGIGEDIHREGLADTPERIAKMYTEIVGGMEEDAAIYLSKVFQVSDNEAPCGYFGCPKSMDRNNEMVMEKDIVFHSTCEHHMLPFFGKVHIAYVPDGKVVGLSKIARTVEVYAKRLQLQEQMTVQIADAFMEYLKPQGVMVMIEAEHMCMAMRGVKKPGAKTVTMTTRGIFKDNPEMQNTFFQMIK